MLELLSREETVLGGEFDPTSHMILDEASKRFPISRDDVLLIRAGNHLRFCPG